MVPHRPARRSLPADLGASVRPGADDIV